MDLGTGQNERLDQFESLWRSGSIPDVEKYLSDLDVDSVQYLHDLIALDLEYRWKRFRGLAAEQPIDGRGLPPLPILEDYAGLLPSRRAKIVTPQLIAEEYRVRVRWGDRPDRDCFHERFSDQGRNLKDALDQVESELRIDFESTVANQAEHSSVSDALNTTVTKRETEQESNSTPGEVPAQLDHYRLDAIIGRGGFGEVWRAYDTKLECVVAIKVPRRDREFPVSVVESFKREGQKLAGIRDIDGVVTVYAAGECDARPYLVSRLIEGENLAQRLKRQPLLLAEAVDIVATVAEILHRAHKKDLVHRDVKPANILLDERGRPFLADFGLAVTEQEQLREHPGILGTYAYMSPEQARGDSHRVDSRTDIYSLGVVLYRALTGRLPFLGDRWEDYEDQILHKNPRPPRTIDDQIPVAIEAVCLKCLAKSPADRFTTVADVAAQLRSASAVPWARPFRRYCTRRTFASVAIGSVVAATAAPLLIRSFSSHADSVTPQIPEEIADTSRLFVRELKWDGDTSTTTWDVKHDKNQIQLATDGIAMLAFGEIVCDCSWSVDLRQPMWPGRIGLFFGYVVDDANGIVHYDAIQISRRRDGSHVVNGKKWLFAIGRPTNHSNPENWASIDIGQLRDQSVTILLQFQDGDLQSGSLGNHELDSFRGRQCRPGPIGVWCMSDSCIVEKPFVNGVPQAFQRAE